jgi:hypothetical protein
MGRPQLAIANQRSAAISSQENIVAGG